MTVKDDLQSVTDGELIHKHCIGLTKLDFLSFVNSCVGTLSKACHKLFHSLFLGFWAFRIETVTVEFQKSFWYRISFS